MTQVSNLLVTLNSSVNFIIYCIYGEKFRRLFCYLFCKTCGGGQEENRHIQRYTTTRGGILVDRSQAYDLSTTRPSASYMNNTSLTEIASSKLKVPMNEVNGHFVRLDCFYCLFKNYRSVILFKPYSLDIII